MKCESAVDKWEKCPDNAEWIENKEFPDWLDDAIKQGWTLGGCNMYFRCPKCSEQAKKEGYL